MAETRTPRRSRSESLDPRRIPVRELMRTDVLTLRADDTIEAAVELFEEYRVSGAPVLDEAGRPVGVLSVSDIARRDHLGEGGVTTRHDRQDLLDEFADEACEDEITTREDYGPELLGRIRVKEWMTARVIRVPPDASVAAVCRLMLEESIHRVFVTEGSEIRGVFSTYDLVRLLAGD